MDFNRENATVKGELDALDIKRGPPSSLALNGASAYNYEQLKPQMEKQIGTKNAFAFSTSQTMVDGRGPATWVPAHEGQHGVAELLAHAGTMDTATQLAAAEYTMAQQEPVVLHDLHEIAMKKTQELVEKDAMKLHFKAFMYEQVEDSELEMERCRVFELHYHIADGKLKVHEPAVENSGLRTGDWAKPHVPYKPDGSGQPYGPLDFAIGSTVYIYGHPFTIVDANGETRALLAHRYGVELGEGLPVPELGNTGVAPRTIGHHPHLNKVVCDANDEEDPSRGFYRKTGDTKGKFLEHGSAVLRFECEWRETAEPFGDRRRFALQYYLADDTLEILDKSSAHSRGGQFNKFVARQRLPRLPLEAGTDNVVAIPSSGSLGAGNGFGRGDVRKATTEGISLPDAGEVMAMAQAARSVYKFSSGPTVWGRFNSPITGLPIYKPSTAKSTSMTEPAVTIGGFPVLTSLGRTPDFVTAGDLVCGGVISVFGRPLLIKTCDPYTAAFGMHKLGIDQRRGFITDRATVASERAAVMPQSIPRGPLGLLPHTGIVAIGSEEETRVNASKVIPTFRSERNFDRFMQLGGKVLRFEARLDPETCAPGDTAREFVVSFYLEDDTMAVVEVMRDRKGASATRWLSRGKHRNAAGAPDPDALAAVVGGRGAVPLASMEQQAAYDRVFFTPGEKFGYGDGFGGAGYGGGIFGKQDRVGPGGTGVATAADMGVRDSMTHTWMSPPRLFKEEDFHPGAIISLAHAPGQSFILGRPDGFTASFLQAQAAQGATDARDVYVPDNKVPVPVLPLESLQAGEAVPGAAPSVSDELAEDCLTLAKVLAGVSASVGLVMRQADKAGRGFAPQQVMAMALAKYGAAPPAVPSSIIARVISAFTIGTGGEIAAKAQAEENARCKKHPKPRPLTAAGAPGGSPSKTMVHTFNTGTSKLSDGAGAIGTLSDPLTGPHILDFQDLEGPYARVPMVDYNALMRTVKAVADRQGTLQPRLDKLVPQLRMALLSSRTHLRRVFRELDTAGTGVITFKEFRAMLTRHHLDVGINDAQVRAVMSRFPPADAVSASAAGAGAGEPCISWRGFIESMLDARTLAPSELENFVDFVRGIRDTAPDGVGGTRTSPEVYPHVNTVSSWGVDMDLRSFGITQAQAPIMQASTRTAPVDATRRSTARPRSSAGGARLTGVGHPPDMAILPQPDWHAPRVPLAPPAEPSYTESRAMNERAYDYLASSQRLKASGGRPATAAGRSSAGAAPPAPPASMHASGTGMGLMRASTAPALTLSTEPVGRGPAHTIPVNIAPDLPGAAPRRVPFGSTDPRFPPAQPELDVVSSLASDPKGQVVLDRMRSVFGTRRMELYRSLALYDTGRKHVLDVPAFISALQSAGMRMSSVQTGEVTRLLLTRAAAGGPARALPYPHDVRVNYTAFLDDLYDTHE